MIIRINGKEENVSGKININDLVEDKGLNQKRIVIEHNLEIIPAEKWQAVSLREGDTVEIITFMGGG